MRQMKPIAIFVMGVVLGGVAAYVLRSDVSPDAMPQDRRIFRADHRAKARPVRRDDLRERLAGLERRLAETRRRTEAAMRPALDAARRPFDADAVLKYQKENDPTGYAYRTNSIIRAAVLRTQSNREDLDLLTSVDTTGWESGARAAFEEYVELSDYLAQYEAKLDELRMLDPDLPAGYGYDAIGQEICRKLELQCDVRYRLMAEAAKRYGLSEEEAMSLADVSHRVVENTMSHGALREQRERNEARHRELELEAAAAAGGAR